MAESAVIGTLFWNCNERCACLQVRKFLIKISIFKKKLLIRRSMPATFVDDVYIRQKTMASLALCIHQHSHSMKVKFNLQFKYEVDTLERSL
jgi:hypothetical protein